MQKLRRKLTLLGAVMALFLLGSVVFAAWLVTGNGNGAAQATSAANLVVTPGTTTADLYPGATGAVKVNVNNPNAFGVTITSIAANGAITTGAPGCTTTGVTFTAPATTGQVIAAGATAQPHAAERSSDEQRITQRLSGSYLQRPRHRFRFKQLAEAFQPLSVGAWPLTRPRPHGSSTPQGPHDVPTEAAELDDGDSPLPPRAVCLRSSAWFQRHGDARKPEGVPLERQHVCGGSRFRGQVLQHHGRCRRSVPGRTSSPQRARNQPQQLPSHRSLHRGGSPGQRHHRLRPRVDKAGERMSESPRSFPQRARRTCPFPCGC